MNAKKIAGRMLKFVGWTLLVLLALVLALPLWINPIGRPIVRSVASGCTGTACELKALHLNPYTAYFEMDGLRIGNPPGYKEPHALSLGRLLVDVKTGSLFDDTLVIEDVVLEDLDIAMDTDANGVGNFAALAKNLQGEASEADEKKDESSETKTSEPGKPRKVIIDHVLIRNIRLRYFTPGVPILNKSLPMPDVGYTIGSIELRDLGRSCGGYDVDELWPTLLKLFWEAVSQQGVDLMKFGISSLDDLSKAACGAGAKALDAIKAGTPDAVKAAAGKTGEMTKSAVSKVGEAAKGLATKTTEGTVNSVKGAAGTIKGLFK